MAKFQNKHRYFVQFMLSNGTVPESEALSFLSKVSPDDDLKTLISEINREIVNQSFKIAFTVCEITGRPVYVWLNTKNDEISKLQMGLPDVEKEYFHSIMQEIATSEEHTVLYPRCINITSTLTAPLTRENGERALMRWIRGGYFVKKDANVYLGPRLILEFTSYLRVNTNNCSCNLCSELVFVGKSCTSCEKTFHSYCIEKYLQSQHTCPSCKEDWEDLMDTDNQ